ncbi:MAG: SDR family oxidoreductase [Candidatus Planktophila sp.]|jgi:NAD(P)-dependent dehydrogenase (short-subunit alcohol dehydrogenase family)|tara:strand:+ start:2951 stop:3655 length:705 start_codon:yes stop_codon:yes gene_type:complete
MSYAGKVILVTGASGFIGRSYVSRFLELGAIVCAQVNTGDIPSAKNLHIIAEDLSIPKSGTSLVQEAVSRAGKLDFVINNAANQSVLDPTLAKRGEIESMMRVNVDAPREIIEESAISGVQVVLNISSVEALNPRSGHEIYGASKAALDQLTRTASRSHSPMRVLGLRLGLIGKPGIDQAWPEGVAAWKAATPTARYASAAEVVGVTEFLLSDANAWATGNTYDFDGGLGAQAW